MLQSITTLVKRDSSRSRDYRKQRIEAEIKDDSSSTSATETKEKLGKAKRDRIQQLKQKADTRA